jgi:hypothetical protein
MLYSDVLSAPGRVSYEVPNVRIAWAPNAALSRRRPQWGLWQGL